MPIFDAVHKGKAENYLKNPNGAFAYKSRTNGCWGAIYNSSLKNDYEFVRAFINHPSHACHSTPEEQDKYCKLLRRMGFHLSMPFEVEFSLTDYYGKTTGKKVTLRAVDIYIQKNSAISNLILLNAVRYMWDHRYYEGASAMRDFLAMAEQKSRVSMWNRFLLAHTTSQVIAGESMKYYSPGQPYAPMTLRQFRTQVLDNPRNITRVADNLPKCAVKGGDSYDNGSAFNDRIRTMFHQKKMPVSAIFKAYKDGLAR